LPIEKPRFHEALEGYLAFVLQNGNLTRLALSAANRQKVFAQFRRGNRGPRCATQPLVLPWLSAISPPCTSAGRVQKRRGRVKGGAMPQDEQRRPSYFDYFQDILAKFLPWCFKDTDILYGYSH
jgi:hypothetical protein